MKNRILLLILLVCGYVNAQDVTQTDPNAPIFKFETEKVDYGTIEKGADGNREFKFTNVGKSPLIISNVQSSCGCLVPSWPKEPIMPGKSAVIKAHYDTQRVGAFTKTLTVTSNATRPSLVLTIKGIVLAPANEVPEKLYVQPKEPTPPHEN